MKATLVGRFKNTILYDLANKLGSQAALAEYLGVSGSTLGHWLHFTSTPRESFLKSDRGLYFQQQLASLGFLVEDIFTDEIKEITGKVEKVEITREVLSLNEVKEPLLLKGDIDKTIMHQELTKAIEEVLGSLKNTRKVEILKYRFGLEDGIEHTLAETVEKFGTTHERIRQIENSVLEKLRKGIGKSKLLPFLSEFNAGQHNYTI